MKEISNYLIHFIEQEFINKEKNIFMNQSKTTEFQKLFLENILQEIRKAELEYTKINSTLIKQEFPISINNINKSDDFSYIPQSIRNQIENTEIKSVSYKFSLFEQQIQIYIAIPSTIKNGNRYFENCLYRIYLWLFIIYPYRNNSCSQTLDIYLYLLDIPKRMNPNNHVILNQEMVNTAFTFSCKRNNSINIFREEEWFKVFIHETMHSNCLDFSDSLKLTEISKNRILNMFSIQTRSTPLSSSEFNRTIPLKAPLFSNPDVLLYETYSELNAELINIIFFIYFSTKKNDENYHKLCLKKFKKYLIYESVFSCFQSTKVLHYNKVKYQDIHTKKPNNYREQTNVFVYYVLKSILLNHIDDYFEWLFNKNKGSLKFIKTEKQINSFVDLIQKNYMNPSYLLKIENMEKWFLKNNRNRIENTTLRMSLLEFV